MLKVRVPHIVETKTINSLVLHISLALAVQPNDNQSLEKQNNKQNSFGAFWPLLLALYCLK